MTTTSFPPRPYLTAEASSDNSQRLERVTLMIRDRKLLDKNAKVDSLIFCRPFFSSAGLFGFRSVGASNRQTRITITEEVDQGNRKAKSERIKKKKNK